MKKVIISVWHAWHPGAGMLPEFTLVLKAPDGEVAQNFVNFAHNHFELTDPYLLESKYSDLRAAFLSMCKAFNVTAPYVMARIVLADPLVKD